MRSRFSLLSLIALFALTIFMPSCQKDEISNSGDDALSYRSATSFTFSVNPAMPGDSIVITYDAENGADCGQIQLQVSGPDGEGWVTSGKPIRPDSGIATILFVPEEPGEYHVRAKYTRTGKPSSCDFESSGWIEAADFLIVEGDSSGMEEDTSGMEEDTSACEASFTGEAISCDSTREVVFTYVFDEDLNHIKIQGGLTNGTMEDAVVTVVGADLDVTQRTPGHSSNRIITLEGSVEACTEVTITITWNSTNQGSTITGEWSATGGFELEGLECE
jgi:hypothetical protein